MQRAKGHGNQGGVRNGTENGKHENVNNWAHQGYNHTNSSMAAGAYSLSNYYGASYHFPAYCMGDGTTQWPNNEPVTYVNSYNGQIAPETAAAYSVDGVYNAATYNGPYNQSTPANATSFNYYSGNAAEYPKWNANTTSTTSDYYRENVYNGVDSVKGITNRLQSLDVGVDSSSNKLSEPKFSYGSIARNNTAASNDRKTTWASIAKQPAKPVPQASSGGSKKKGPGMPPPPMVPGRHNIDLNTWEPKNNNVVKTPVAQAPPPPSSTPSSLPAKPVWNGPFLAAEVPSEANAHFDASKSMIPPTQLPVPPAHTNARPNSSPPQSHKPFSGRPTPAAPAVPSPTPTSAPPTNYHPPTMSARPPPVSESITNSAPPPSQTVSSSAVNNSSPPSVVEKLKDRNNYNPSELEFPPQGTRFFVIKSYSEDDVHRSIKYEIWCSTEHGNKRLDEAFADQRASNGAVYLFFSVNGSGHFCGVAKMVSSVDYDASSSVWAQDKWKGQFKVRWIYVKDVPNVQLRHIRLENNENKPVTTSRDAQEVPYDKGVSVLKIIHSFSHITSIFDDFTHYEKRQEEGDVNKRVPPHQGPQMHQNSNNYRNPFGGRSMLNKDRDGGTNYSHMNHNRDGSSNHYSQMNHNRDGGSNSYSQMNRRGGGGARNGGSFTNHRNHSNALRS